MLCCKFSDTEILDVVNQCESSKSPCPDRFNFHFIKKNWDIIGADMVKDVYNFYECWYIPRGYNTSFIILVPKRKNPSTFTTRKKLFKDQFLATKLNGC